MIFSQRTKRILLKALCVAALFIPTKTQANDSETRPPLKNITLEASMKTMEAIAIGIKGDHKQEEILLNEALEIYNKGLDKEPENLHLLKGRGLVKDHMEEGSGDDDLNKVIDIATKKIEDDPKHAYSYYHRASAYRSLKKFDKARDDYKKAIELRPDKENWPIDLKAMELQAKQAQ